MSIAFYFINLILFFTLFFTFDSVPDVLNLSFKIMTVVFLLLSFTFCIIKKFPLIINFLTLWFGFQRFIALALAGVSAFTYEIIRNFFLVKEVLFLYILAVLIIARLFMREKVKLIKVDYYAALFVLIIVIYSMLSNIPIWLKLLSLRRLLMLTAVYFVGRFCIINSNSVKNVIKYIIYFAYGICIWGLIDYFFLRNYLYNEIFNLSEYINKQVAAGFMSAAWFSKLTNILDSGHFTEYAWGIPIPRLVSTFLEPTTLGSFLAFATLFSIFAFNILPFPRKMKNILSIMLFVSLVLTFSKGALLIFFCGASFIIFFNKKISYNIRLIILWLTYGVISLIMLKLFVMGSGAMAHINGLSSGFYSALLHPFGIGLGNAGNFIFLLPSNESAQAIGCESAVGALLAQTGFLGTGALFLFYFVAIKQLINSYFFTDNKVLASFYVTTAGCLVGYIINSFFTDSANGLTGNFYYFLFLGIMISISIKERFKK